MAGVAPWAGQPRLLAKWGARLEDAERATIKAAIRQAGGDRRAASELLGISRKTLYRKLKAYNLVPDQIVAAAKTTPLRLMKPLSPSISPSKNSRVPVRGPKFGRTG